MTDDERRTLESLMARDAIATLEVVVRCLETHAVGQRAEPHRTAWFRIAQGLHANWMELRRLPGGRR